MPIRVEADTLRRALEITGEAHERAWRSLGLRRRLGGKGRRAGTQETVLEVFWEPSSVPSGFEPEATHRRRDDPISRFHGTFRQRLEHQAELRLPYHEE